MNVVSGLAATKAIAQLTARRFFRSRILIVAAVFAFTPLLPFFLGAGADDYPDDNWRHFVMLATFVQLLVAALLMAPAIAEEIEEKTYTYLWSRPIPRWSVLAGKLLTGSVIGILLFVACTLAGSAVSGYSDGPMLGKAMLGMSLGVVAVGCAGACFGTLIPKHPLPFAISYFLILDSGVGAMPFAAARLSVLHNVRAVTGHGPDADTLIASILWLVGISAFWVLITVWRLDRKELSTGS